jgi:hypothetical protein
MLRLEQLEKSRWLTSRGDSALRSAGLPRAFTIPLVVIDKKTGSTVSASHNACLVADDKHGPRKVLDLRAHEGDGPNWRHVPRVRNGRYLNTCSLGCRGGLI